MTEVQRLFLVQARSDFAVFSLLGNHTELPRCHELHYLQMATELLGKAHACKDGPPEKSHHAFVPFLRRISANRMAQRRLGHGGKNQSWKHLIRKSIPLAERIEDLAPALAGDGPNPEYPWPSVSPQIAPVEYEFDLWRELRRTGDGRQFLKLLEDLFTHADAFL